MGRAIVRLAQERGDVAIVCGVGADSIGTDLGELAGTKKLGVAVAGSIDAIAKSGANVVIDFAAPAATADLARVAANAGVAIVSGTTGLHDEATRALDAASAKVPVLWEPNMSVGVHILGELVRRAVAALGADFDIEITEAHHNKKIDAPSGTALRLAEIARDARATAPAFRHGREGRPGTRPQNEIGMHALRGGDVIGDHSVHLLGGGERLELTHRATSRDVFAHGALRAAAWIAGKPAGRYRMTDVLA
jgi:4-hydroxy-tetrahydrodipicolinate reductase